VTFKDMPVSDAIEAACLREAAKLERYAGDITSCRVVVARPHHRHRRGNLYEVRVDITLPGGEVVVNREPAEHHADESELVAIREAFDTARRRLEDFVRRRSGRVKVHEELPHGRIAELYPIDGYGFIASPDGRSIYFHRNSVLRGAFDRLAVGSVVRFVEEDGVKGPQASTVEPAS
jgi:cold shock CspA family protein